MRKALQLIEWICGIQPTVLFTEIKQDISAMKKVQSQKSWGKENIYLHMHTDALCKILSSFYASAENSKYNKWKNMTGDASVAYITKAGSLGRRDATCLCVLFYRDAYRDKWHPHRDLNSSLSR